MKSSIATALAMAIVAVTVPAFAQQGGQQPHPAQSDTMMPGMPGMSMDHSSHQDTTARDSSKQDTAHMQMMPMHHHHMHDMKGMAGMESMPSMSMMHGMMPLGPLGQPMARSGSGTSWLPDASPMYAVHRMADGWTLMAHGQAFLQYDDQGGRRGGDQFGSSNWGMAMASHDFGAPAASGNATSRLTLRTMLSLDPATVTLRGYPLLLQSGESYNGTPLHDRQHPHDLFMELAAMYDQQVTPNLGFELYAAPAGEPASGPVAFMHRPSAINDPFAPISHHWQDATHISYGVLTTGVFTKTVKVEGSWFNGREPDQHRYDIEMRRLDSYSGRLTINPDPHWSLEGSYAFLKSPEALTPDVSQHRVTAAAMYGRTFGAHGDWSTSAIYGANKAADVAALSNSALLETNLAFDDHNAIFGRAEIVQKSNEELDVISESLDLQATGMQYTVGAISLGYMRELITGHTGSLGIGAQGTVNIVPQPLQPYYGTRMPLGLGVFLRYRPQKMQGM